MSIRDETRTGIRIRQQQKDQLEAATRVNPAEHFATLGRDLDALYREHPDRAGGVALWAEGMHEIVPPGLDVLETVRFVCVWFEGVLDLHCTHADATESVARMDAKERQAFGQSKGILLAAIHEVEQLHEAKFVEWKELVALRGKLAEIVARLPVGPEPEAKSARGVTLERQFGETLMSLLMAAGFRNGAGQRFTIGKAASHAAKIASCYGFKLSENSLRTWASQLNKKKV